MAEGRGWFEVKLEICAFARKTLLILAFCTFQPSGLLLSLWVDHSSEGERRGKLLGSGEFLCSTMKALFIVTAIDTEAKIISYTFFCLFEFGDWSYCITLSGLELTM